MDVGLFTTFLAVVHHQTFSGAARSLDLSTSAVSQQIRALETEFGVRLFDRGERPPRLTDEGKEFCEHARRVLGVLSEMRQVGASSSLSGVLSVGAVHSAVSGLLPIALERLEALHPDVDVRLTSGLALELDAALRRGSLDVAVLAQPDTLPTGLVWQSCCTEPLVVAAPEAVAGDTDAEVLENAPFIRFKRVGWSVARVADAEFARRGIQVQTRIEVDTLEGILGLVAHGLGVSVVPRRHVPEPFPPGVRVVPFGSPPLHRTIGVLYAEDGARQKLVQPLIEALVATAALHGEAPEPGAN